MERTIENILTAFIEVSGVILTEESISAESYPEAMRKIGKFFGYREEDSEILARLAIQRNRLAHRYLNFRWEVVQFYKHNRDLLKRLLKNIYEYEVKKQESP